MEEIDVKEVKSKLLSLLKSNHKITLTWDCGGDEAFIHFLVDGNELFDQEDSFTEDFEWYLLNKLQLPDAGEFSMEGGGTVTLEGERISLEYESILKGYEGDDGWEDVNQKEDAYSGQVYILE